MASDSSFLHGRNIAAPIKGGLRRSSHVEAKELWPQKRPPTDILQIKPSPMQPLLERERGIWMYSDDLSLRRRMLAHPIDHASVTLFSSLFRNNFMLKKYHHKVRLGSMPRYPSHWVMRQPYARSCLVSEMELHLQVLEDNHSKRKKGGARPHSWK